MIIDPDLADAYKRVHSRAALEEILRDAVTVHANGAEVQRSYEGTALTISQENAERIIGCARGALDLYAAEDAGDTSGGQLSGTPVGIGVDFSYRRIR